MIRNQTHGKDDTVKEAMRDKASCLRMEKAGKHLQ